MDLNQENINSFIDKYVYYVDNISRDFEYNENIKHLLYLIVPAFVVKYGINNESTVLNCFKNVKVYINGTYDKIVTATFNRSLKKDNDNFYTDKFIMINNYSESKLPTLIDNIVHEFNHAINSTNNEITCDDKYVKVRTGLTTLNYLKDSLKFEKKSNTTSLEEILNTAQTEDVVNIINSFGRFYIENVEISNALYALRHEIGDKKYVSDGYQYQKQICSSLINNKTFTPTVNNLRFKGTIEDIPYLFDNVIGIDGSYNKLNKLLNDMHTLILKYAKSKYFKNRLLNKIKSKAKEVSNLIDEYESKCIFK